MRNPFEHAIAPPDWDENTPVDPQIGATITDPVTGETQIIGLEVAETPAIEIARKGLAEMQPRIDRDVKFLQAVSAGIGRAVAKLDEVLASRTTMQ